MVEYLVVLLLLEKALLLLEMIHWQLANLPMPLEILRLQLAETLILSTLDLPHWENRPMLLGEDRLHWAMNLTP